MAPGNGSDAMRDLGLNEEQRSLRCFFRAYLAEKIDPVIAECEAQGEFPRWLLPDLAEFGLLGGTVPKSLGGLGLDHVDMAVLMEETGYRWTSLRSTANTLGMIADVLARHGSAEQQQRYLPGLLAGEKLVFFGQTEPDQGSDIRALKTTAVRDGDHYVVSGTKMWITNGAIADFGLLLVNVIPRSEDEPGGLTALIVDPDECEYESHRIATMFLKATTTSELVFDKTRIPVANVVGEVGQGGVAFLGGLDQGRLNVAMGAVGASQRALDMSSDYARSRVQFGKRIGQFQLVQELVSDIRVQTAAARALGYAAAQTLAAGRGGRAECAMAKLFATETAYRSLDKAIQVHGAIGTSVELGLERMFRDARGGLIIEGTSQMQRLVIAKDQLGLAAFV